MNQPTETLGERINQLKKVWGDTNIEFGKRIGVNNSTVGKVIANEVGLKHDSLLALFANGVNLNWLLTGDGAMFLKEKTDPSESVEEKFVQVKQSDLDALKASFERLYSQVEPTPSLSQNQGHTPDLYENIADRKKVNRMKQGHSVKQEGK